MIRSLSKLSVLLAALLSLSALGATVALADTSYSPTASFATTPGPGDGEVNDPQRVAVESASGNVLLVDRGNNRVQAFKSDGSYLAQFGPGVLNSPLGIAIDQSNGDVYVSDAAAVVRFQSDGAPVPTYIQDATFNLGVTGPLAFDQGANQLVVANGDHVRRYATDGTAGTSFDGSASGTAFSNLKDIAIQDDGDVVVIDTTRVLRFKNDDSYAATITGLPGTPDVIAALPAGDSLLIGHIGGYNEAYTQLFTAEVYRVTSDAYRSTTSLGDGVYGFRGLAVAPAAGPLYAVTAAEWFGGTPGVTVAAPFVVQLPIVSDVSATPTERGARLKGSVNPNHDATSWTFEYGTTTSYGRRFPVTGATMSAGDSPVAVQTVIGGLQPGTVYHYRLVATNGAGSAASIDRTFSTQSTGAPESGARDDGRVYEQVSPVDKGGQDPYPKPTVAITDDGDRALFASAGSFADGAGSVLFNYYGADRTAGNWATTNLNPPITNDRFQYAASTRGVSSDLRHVVQVSARALTPDAVEGAGNVYLLDRQTGTRRLMVTMPAWAGGEFAAPGAYQPVIDASDDFSHILFLSGAMLKPGAVGGIENGPKNLYEWSAEGGLQLASAPPSGDPPLTDGAVVPNQDLAPVNAHAISADGSRIVFGNAVADRLFVRENGVTREILPGGSSKSVLTLTRDGRYAFVISNTPRLPGAGSFAIYRYDLDTGDLVNFSPIADPDPADGGSVDVKVLYGVSSDGRRAYFSSGGKLTADASPRTSQIYVSDEGQVKLVGALSPFSEYHHVSNFQLSEDGHYFLFQSYASLTGYVSRSDACDDSPFAGEPAGHCSEVFLYGADADTLDCVSCDAHHTPVGPSRIRSELQSLAPVHPRWVLDDGEAFFQTRSALVSADTNRQIDVYSWKGHKLRLISSGNSSTESTFANATPDGSSVFFYTGEQLVGQDIDRNVDLYVARRGGGLAAQGVDPRETPEPCTGEACRPVPAASRRESAIDTDGGASQGDGAVDRATVKVKALTASQRAALAHGRKVSLAVVVNRAGTVSMSATAKVGKRSSTVAAGTVKATKAQTVHVPLGLAAAARRQLAATGALRVAVVVRFTGAKAQSLVVNLRPVKPAAKRSASSRRGHSFHTTTKGR